MVLTGRGDDKSEGERPLGRAVTIELLRRRPDGARLGIAATWLRDAAGLRQPPEQSYDPGRRINVLFGVTACA